ncbi:amidohydrolase [Microlunatus sagamiharensis]|uniref:amidohydrolase n=1 Tax=Microlunatus sagamiharensis TaxID=546874 RepID=UPI0012FD5B4E|nr:amidohydrolase [Microlunatus sagamiharensis]
MILHGGTVVVPGRAPVEAIAVRDGRVLAVGSSEEVRAAEPGGPVVDLDGRLVTPAFVDAHLHAVQGGLASAGVDLHGVSSVEELLHRVRAYVERTPGRGVVLGQGWDERSWPDPRPPSRAELDEAGRGRPLYLARVDVHSAVVSSALLAALPGIEGLTGWSEDGPLTQDAHHVCRGRLDILTTDAERRSAARTVLAEAAALGVGEVHELGGPHLGPVADLERVRDEGHDLGLRVVTYWGELASDAAFARMESVGARGLAGDLCVDGAIGSRTAALVEDYADGPGRGAQYLDADELTAHLRACTLRGVSGGFHCIGDAGVSAAVEGLRRVAQELGEERVRAARHRLEHVEMVAAADLPLLARLGVTASVQPAFDAAWGGPGELYEERVGARSSTMNPFASMLHARVPVAFGTDAPVTAVAGWAMVRDAVRHRRPAERMRVAEAFRCATVGGHAAAGDDASGTLAVGAPAHLAVWDTEPSRLDPATGLPLLAGDAGGDADPGLPVCAATLVEGRVVFDGGAVLASV